MAKVTKKIIQEFWTRNVPGLDEFSKKYSYQAKEFYLEADRYRHKYEPAVVPLIDYFAREGRLVLEVGCGIGYDTRYIAKKGADVIGLDLSYENAYLTKRGFLLLNLKGEGICADAEHLPFKDNSFDVVYSFGVLHHTLHTEKAVAEIYRVLKNAGTCVVMLYHKGYAYYWLYLIHGWRSQFLLESKEELTNRYDNTPLSKMYSKSECRKMFSMFSRLEFEVTTYGGIQIHPILKYIWAIFNKSNFLMRHFGSFLIIKGRK